MPLTCCRSLRQFVDVSHFINRTANAVSSHPSSVSLVLKLHDSKSESSELIRTGSTNVPGPIYIGM